ARVLEAADRLRPRGGDAGAQVAREIQRSRARALGGPHVRQRADARARVARGPHLSWRLGVCAISIPVRAGAEPARVAAPDARVVPGDRALGRDCAGERRVEPAQARLTAVGRRIAAVDRAGLCRRGPRPVPGRAVARFGPSEAPPADHRPVPGPADGPSARAVEGGPHPLAPARSTAAGAALAGDRLHLVRAPRGAGPAAASDGGGAAGGWGLRAPRWPVRLLGPRGPRRVLWCGPPGNGRGGAPRRPAACSAPLVAPGPTTRTRIRFRRGVAGGRRGARPRLGRRGNPRRRRPAPRLA